MVRPRGQAHVALYSGVLSKRGVCSKNLEAQRTFAPSEMCWPHCEDGCDAVADSLLGYSCLWANEYTSRSSCTLMGAWTELCPGTWLRNDTVITSWSKRFCDTRTEPGGWGLLQKGVEPCLEPAKFNQHYLTD